MFAREGHVALRAGAQIEGGVLQKQPVGTDHLVLQPSAVHARGAPEVGAVIRRQLSRVVELPIAIRVDVRRDVRHLRPTAHPEELGQDLHAQRHPTHGVGRVDGRKRDERPHLHLGRDLHADRPEDLGHPADHRLGRVDRTRRQQDPLRARPAHAAHDPTDIAADAQFEDRRTKIDGQPDPQQGRIDLVHLPATRTQKFIAVLIEGRHDLEAVGRGEGIENLRPSRQNFRSDVVEVPVGLGGVLAPEFPQAAQRHSCGRGRALQLAVEPRHLLARRREHRVRCRRDQRATDDLGIVARLPTRQRQDAADQAQTMSGLLERFALAVRQARPERPQIVAQSRPRRRIARAQTLQEVADAAGAVLEERADLGTGKVAPCRLDPVQDQIKRLKERVSHPRCRPQPGVRPRASDSPRARPQSQAECRPDRSMSRLAQPPS